MITSPTPTGREIRANIKRLINDDDSAMGMIDRLAGYCINVRNQVIMDSHPTPLRERMDREKRTRFYLGFVAGVGAAIAVALAAAYGCQ